jgi:hypothetical protein
MNTEYRVETAGEQFIVIDPWGEQVDTYATEDAAKTDIERCKKEDAMNEGAKMLVDIAIQAHAKSTARQHNDVSILP